ncbi:MAG: Crp/Fnr family transcriptional regulator [Luteibaculaceae bacterium]
MHSNNSESPCCGNCAASGRSLFGGLCSKSLESISAEKSCTFYKKGQTLFHEGTRPLGVFCINQGRIKVFKLGSDGKEQIIKVSTSGDLLGYKALIAQDFYGLTATALEDSKVCFLPKSDFLDLLAKDNTLQSAILKQVCIENEEMAQRITNLAQKPVRQRLAITLLMLKHTYGIEKQVNEDIEINLTREDLANIVGTATESLIRLLHEFKDDNFIEVNGRKIKVLDENALKKVSLS